MYYLFVGIVIVLGFLPFYSSELIAKYSSSVGLWFGNFEFNASIYYIVRAIGYKFTGYNVIQIAGKILPLVTLFSVLILAFKRRNEFPEILLTSIVFSYFIYLLLSTTVHPWYLTIPLLFSVFTRYRFMIVWSFVIFLSYFAYSNEAYTENLWLILLEYAIVLVMFIYEYNRLSMYQKFLFSK